MAAAMAVRVDVSSSTGIEQHMRSREELAYQVTVLRLGSAAARSWRQLGASEAGQSQRQESLPERFERVTGRPLAAACPTGCSCRGQTAVRLS